MQKNVGSASLGKSRSAVSTRMSVKADNISRGKPHSIAAGKNTGSGPSKKAVGFDKNPSHTNNSKTQFGSTWGEERWDGIRESDKGHSDWQPERRQTEENGCISAGDWFDFRSNDTYMNRKRNQSQNAYSSSAQSSRHQNSGNRSMQTNWKNDSHRGGEYVGNHEQENKVAKGKNHINSKISNASSTDSLNYLDNKMRQDQRFNRKKNNNSDWASESWERYPEEQKGHASCLNRPRVRRGDSPHRQSPNKYRTRNKFDKYPFVHNHDNNMNDLYRIPRRFAWLIGLSEMNGTDIATQLVNSHSGFEELIGNIPLMKDKPDMLVLILKLLAKVGDADFKENKNKLFTLACNMEFLDQLSTFLTDVAVNNYKSTVFDINNFLKDVLLFTKGVLISLPVTAAERFKKVLLMVDVVYTSAGICQQTVINHEIKDMKDNLQEQLKEIEMKQKNDEVKITSRLELLSAQAPPNNFREINLIPTVEDIFSGRSFVRPNLIKGAYTSIEHYLDVQFRLLHEDFLCPMREGIVEYMQKVGAQKRGRVSNIRIYQKVMFLSPRVVSDKIGIVVNFDPDKRLKKMNWKNSKRFLYGSLLCFTQDNFRSIMFGTIVERNEKDLIMNQIVVELCDGSQIRDDLFKTQYTMAESEVYFEPYYQALKEMNEDNFPMKHYIVDAQQETGTPNYLLDDGDFTNYVMKPNFRFPILYPETWPSAEDLNLDPSQYRAFRLALTKEFVVIQGPPGTGKTFLGLKVAEVMLENSKKWNEEKQPILVVCYTNHALDQFMEGILPHTSEIVRVGGQSKSDVVNAFNLKELRRGYKKWMYNPKSKDMPNVNAKEGNLLLARLRMNTDLSRDIHGRLEQLVTKIKRIQVDLEKIEKNEGIISFRFLSECIDQHHRGAFLKLHNENEDLIDWLLSQNENEINVTQNSGEVEECGSEEEDEGDIFYEIGERGVRDIHEGFDLNVIDVSSNLAHCTSVDMMKFQKKELEEEMEQLETEMKNDHVFYHSRKNVIDRHLADLVHKSKRLEQRLKERKVERRADIDRVLAVRDIWNLNYNDRWILYRHWVSELREKLLQQFKDQEEEFRTEARQYEEVRQTVDLEIMRNSLVVGMTTTGAARLQSLLKALKPKIVIVEEAAEVLESHILVSLTNHTEHLILIGDHKQLRPSTSVYRLAKHFNLDVSLFERMLNNGMHCEILNVQHRMRPEIASLIVPSIYPELLNHRSVTLFDQIQGVSKNLFFLDHTHPDEEAGDTFSHRNVQEALFMVALCRHLVLQGYEPDKITVLATYAAQMFYIRNESKKYELLKGVRITVVDNFQGEENDIILLSLVRSNKDANIGFLKIENRVCVALSRARKGMYIMGNMENLTRSSTIWQKIKDTLERQNAIGEKLELQCQVHPDQHKMVCKAQDFADIPEGGCTLQCGALLVCGHNCQSVCHARDREHKNYKCRVMPCNKVMCILGHKCQKYCYKECGLCVVPVQRQLKCGHEKVLLCHIDYKTFVCMVPVKKVLPACQHEVDVPCSVNPANFSCPISCDARLDECGHTCRRKCHVLEDPDHLDYNCMQPCARRNKGCTLNHPCTKKCHEVCGQCEVIVWKVLDRCGHRCQMKCSKPTIQEVCKNKCERTMECGHKCKKKCFERCGDCAVSVTKKIPFCGHDIKLRCSTVPEHRMCCSPCQRRLTCGHMCTGICGEQCVTECKQMVPNGARAECGHVISIPCYKRYGSGPSSQELLSYCNAPCKEVLKCTHPCVGTCSQCLQGRIHVSCNEKCGRPQICGHSCNIPCAVTCPPCSKKCGLRCRHNKCKKKCGEPCTPCKEPCAWKCEHYRCSKQCSEPCDRPPCSQPCKKVIKKCKHPCIGFCGEPCPQLCRICNEDDVTTVILGNEDEEDARFVLLEDCNHIVEHRDLERWLKVTQEGEEVEVTMPTCPHCKTMITKNVRYSNLIKDRYNAVCEVKKRVFGELDRIERSRNQNMLKLKELAEVIPVENPDEVQIHLRIQDDVLLESKYFVGLFERLVESCNVRTKKNKKNVLSNLDVETLGIQISIISQLVTKAKKVKKHLKSVPRRTMLQQMDVILNVLKCRNKHLSIQEVDDLNLEVQRFHRIADMCVLESMQQFQIVQSQYKLQFENNLKRPLLSINKYSMDQDKILEAVQDQLSTVFKATGIITKEERSQIVKALGMSPGHWFKCPNGHYYIITECGGAMQVGRCNECNAQIGGTDHTLLDTNYHAGEMDGSNHAAWSDAANMANYHFD